MSQHDGLAPELIFPEVEPSTDWTDLLPASEHTVFLKSVNWEASRVGPIQAWPLSLRQAVYLMLGENQPTNIYWGPHLVPIYNAAFGRLIGQRHPAFMGSTFKDGFSGVYLEVLSLFQKAVDSGQATSMDRHSLTLEMNGRRIESHWTATLVPIRDPNTSRYTGIWNQAKDVSDIVIGERRGKMIQHISEGQVCDDLSASQHVMDCLEQNPCDVTMAALYLADKTTKPGKTQLLPLASIGVPKHHILMEPVEDLDSGTGPARLCRHARAVGASPQISEVDSFFDGVEWKGDHGPSSEIAVLTLVGGLQLLGYLVIGFNPRLRAKDEENMRFLNDLSRTVSTIMFSAISAESSLLRQKGMDAHLAAADPKIRHMVMQMSSGMVHYAPDGSMIWANKAYFEILGLAQQKGQKDYATFDTILEEDFTKADHVWQRLTSGKERITEELRLKRLYTPPIGDAIPATISFHAYPYYEDGKVSSIMAGVSDISALKWAESWQFKQAQAARDAKKQQEFFMDVVSHEIRNPLSAIIHCADEIMKYAADALMPASLAKDVEHSLVEIEQTSQLVLTCANHQLHILNSLLLLGHADSALKTFTPSSTTPRTLCERVVTLFGPECRFHDIAVELIEQPSIKQLEVNMVNVDVSRVTQILINLFTNAVKFVQAEVKRKIEITYGAALQDPRRALEFPKDIVWTEQGESSHDVSAMPEFGSGQQIYLTFTVVDTGVGIAATQLHRMFSKFKQVHGKTHSRYGGSGLGLYISKQLVERQGGEVGIQSKVGVGTLFGFYLRVRRTTAQSDVPVSEELTSSLTQRPRVFRPPGRNSKQSPIQKMVPNAGEHALRPRILLVEDNIVNQKLLQKQLTKDNFSVTVANHGVEALEQLKATSDWKDDKTGERPFEVILMDIEMPVMNGLDCMEEIRRLEADKQLKPQAKIITITANAREEQQLAARHAGADMIMTKPFKTAALIQAINSFLGGDS